MLGCRRCERIWNSACSCSRSFWDMRRYEISLRHMMKPSALRRTLRMTPKEPWPFVQRCAVSNQSSLLRSDGQRLWVSPIFSSVSYLSSDVMVGVWIWGPAASMKGLVGVVVSSRTHGTTKLRQTGAVRLVDGWPRRGTAAAQGRHKMSNRSERPECQPTRGMRSGTRDGNGNGDRGGGWVQNDG